MFQDFCDTIEKFGIKSNVYAEANLSEVVAYNVTEEFCLVFLDGDHSYEAVKADIQAWGPLVEEGGILCGHDWDEHGASWPGVHKAVVELLGWPSFNQHIWAFRKVNGEFKAEITW
jgi:cephalosporin hydroxylase